MTSAYFDVHAHLTHQDFTNDLDEVLQRAESAGLKAIVVNGLNPESNRMTLALSQKYPLILPSMGIYPVDGVNSIIKEENLPFKIAKFDVDEEIKFIRSMAQNGSLSAIGECGLDGYWLKDDSFSSQERVFMSLIEIAMNNDLPIIVHSRKLETRCIELLSHYGIKKVVMHCFGGKAKLAEEAAHKYGYFFSIPANARKNESFTKMIKLLPLEKLLTETDCPYLAPVKGARSEPRDVVQTVLYAAQVRSLTLEEVKRQLWTNLCFLFPKISTVGYST